MIYDNKAKGTNVWTGEMASKLEHFERRVSAYMRSMFYKRIYLPSVEGADMYKGFDKSMYTFTDKGGRKLCLRPECTQTIKTIANKHYKNQPVNVWYFERCWRYERPQKGRYREFFQFGIESINTDIEIERIKSIAETVCGWYGDTVTVDNPTRGLHYYTGDTFEIERPDLGAQKQVCGGGRYKGGAGFAIGVERLLL